VIVSCVRTYLQAIAPIESPPDNLIVSTGFAVVRPIEGRLRAGFCKYALREPRFLAEVERRSVGVSYPAINSSDLATIPIPAPPDDLQLRIEKFLDRETARLDALVAAKQRVLDLLAEKRKAIIATAVTRGLDPKVKLRDSGVPWLGEIPAHWQLRRAKYLFRQSVLPVATGDEIVTCFRDGQVTLRRNRREEGFTNADLELGYQGIRKGQLVLHSMDAFAGAIGVSESDGRCSPEYIICDPLDGDLVAPEYFGPLLRTMALAGFIQASCPAVRERAPRIRFNNFGEMCLPVPPQEEQRAVVAHITRETAKLDAVRAATERTIALLKERRAALIAAAVTGQLDLTTEEGVAA
jgi:type I restriction enzyme S subunit